ncbi:MAG TPA: hypothetical protein VFV99_33645 [Kofleriaceae bacterium]|nr:hypothetical protein [Kofleriaceae bacterium]
MRAWPWLLIVCACGDGLPDRDDGAHSGSRLRVAWFDVDGTRQWQPEEGHQYESGRFVNSERFYDKLRDESCAPEPWLDGVTRCTPDVELIARKVFADAACTVRVTQNPQSYRYVGDYDDKCGQRRMWHVFPVVSTMQSASYYIAGDGKCYLLPGMTEIGVLGDELAYDTFATIDTLTTTNGERITIRYRKSQDGMVLPVSLYDATLGTSDLVRDIDGRDVAKPRVAAPASPADMYYDDPSCTHGYVRGDIGCGPPQAALGDADYYAIGDHATASPRYTLTAGSCMQQPIPPAGEFYEVLTATPLALAPVAISVANDETHRIELEHATAPSLALRMRELFDTTLATECKPRQFPDEVYRCAPDELAAQIVPGTYSDPACTIALDLAMVVPEHRQPRFVLQDRSLLGGTVTIYEIGELYTQPYYAFGGAMGTECMPVTPPAHLHALGRVVDWSKLATATLATD